MRFQSSTKMAGLAILVSSLFAGSGASAQNRLVVPEGSVIIVRTATPLESATARVGQRFETLVEDTVRVDDYTVMPAGSRIQGVVTVAQAANRQQSGFIEVKFDRLVLAEGTTYTMEGRLTSTDLAERRQIETDPDARVVLVGGRGGIGAAIAGAGSSTSSASSLLTALGSLLSEGRDVRVPAGTLLAVQLEERLVLRGLRRAPSDALTLYTSEAVVRAAQLALAQQNYYRATIHGQLDNATRRALFEYQVDRNLTATGNLDGRTAQSLGILNGVSSGIARGAVLSANEASLLRRDAQALIGRLRQDLAISTSGLFDVRRTYAESDVDLLFALSAFADNASLYEQLVRGSGGVEASFMAGRALVEAARRVDVALQRGRPSSIVRNGWSAVRGRLTTIDPGYDLRT